MVFSKYQTKFSLCLSMFYDQTNLKPTHLISCLQVFKESRISLEIRWHKLTFSSALYTWNGYVLGRKGRVGGRKSIYFRDGIKRENTSWVVIWKTYVRIFFVVADECFVDNIWYQRINFVRVKGCFHVPFFLFFGEFFAWQRSKRETAKILIRKKKAPKVDQKVQLTRPLLLLRPLRRPLLSL